MLEIHARLGLCCGCADIPLAGGAAALDSAYSRARRQTESLVAEAERCFGGDTPAESIRMFLRARAAGYPGVAAMERDVRALLGAAPDSSAREAYLLLRQGERLGIWRPQPNLPALRAEAEQRFGAGSAKALGELLGQKWSAAVADSARSRNRYFSSR